jgi:hypothetical protein
MWIPRTKDQPTEKAWDGKDNGVNTEMGFVFVVS